MSLGQPAYRNLWIGMLLQGGGQQMAVFTRGYLVFELTGSATLLGIVAGAMSLPIVTLGAFAGVLADRMDKRRMMQMAQALSLVSALGLGLAMTMGVMTWVYLLIAALAQGVVIAFLMPTRQAVIPQLVPKEYLTNAVALSSMGMSITWMVAPALAGGLIGVIGAEGVFYVMAGMHVCVIVLTGFLPPLGNANEARGSFLQDLADGFRYVRSMPEIRLLLLLAFSATLFSEPLRSILPVFAKEIFDVGSGGLGIMLSTMGAGGVVGAVVIAGASKAERRGIRLILAGLLTGTMLLGFSLVSSLAPVFWLGIGFLAVIGTTQPVRMTLNNSLMLDYADPKFRGRVISILFLGMGLVPAAAIPLGILTDAFGAPLALAAMAGCMITLVGTLFVSSRVLRSIQ